MESRFPFTSGTVWPALVILILVAWIYHWRATAWRVVPKNIPWVPTTLPWNERLLRPLTRIRAHLLDFNRGKDFAQEGYDKYNKVGEPFVAPSFTTWQPEVVLPPSQIKWLVQQPDSVLSLHKCLIKSVECEYTTPDAWLFTRAVHLEAINKMRLDLLAGGIQEAVRIGVDEQWGMNTEEWTEVNIHKTMFHVLSRVTANTVVGQPLCSNSEFLGATIDFAGAMPITALLITLTPELLRPIVAWCLMRSLRRATKTCTKYMIPLIQEVMRRRPSDQRTMAPPTTLLEQLSRLAARRPAKLDRSPYTLSLRLLSLSFVAIHTSTQTIQNALVDIFSPPASTRAVFDQLRAEAEDVSRKHSGEWSKTAVAQLVKIDSALRESLRFSTFKARSMERLVVKKEGVVLPSGQFLPRGTKIGVAVLPIHHDDNIYHEAGDFDAFRFSRRKDTTENTDAQGTVSGDGGHVDLVNTSETFLAFGHGTHSCPGRYLAAHELKLIVAYIAMHYDIQPFDSRPSSLTFSDFTESSMHNLRVRRRKSSRPE